MALNVTTLPLPIVFTGLTNVLACVPHNFTFAYNTSDPFILNPAVVNNLTAWMEPVIPGDSTPPEYVLASEMALNENVTAIPWVGGIPADTYALKGLIKTNAPGIIYEPIDVQFVITATANTSCGEGSATPVYPYNTGLPAVGSGTSAGALATNSRTFGGGALAGIVVGALISLLMCATGLFFVLRRGMRKVAQKPSASKRGEAFATEQREVSDIIDDKVSLSLGRRSSEKGIEASMDFEVESMRSIPPSYKEHVV